MVTRKGHPLQRNGISNLKSLAIVSAREVYRKSLVQAPAPLDGAVANTRWLLFLDNGTAKWKS